MVLEIVRKTSLQLGQPLIKHVVGILFLCLVYYVWTALGRLITKQFVYKYLDVNYRGPGALVTTYVSMICLALTMFFAQQGLHTARKSLVRKAYGDRSEQ